MGKRLSKLSAAALVMVWVFSCFQLTIGGRLELQSPWSGLYTALPMVESRFSAELGLYGSDNPFGPMYGGAQDWRIQLVNTEHPLPEDYSVKVVSWAGVEVDERIYEPLKAMVAACKDAGYSPVVCSAYRTIERQSNLFKREVGKWKSNGMEPEQAYDRARKVVAPSGDSEHNMGLAADIYSAGYKSLDEGFAATPEGIWFKEHCAEYGFVLRYEKEKQDITGIIYEPWHFRYVGIENATHMQELGMCLEEYVEHLNQGK